MARGKAGDCFPHLFHEAVAGCSPSKKLSDLKFSSKVVDEAVWLGLVIYESFITNTELRFSNPITLSALLQVHYSHRPGF